MTPDVEFEYVTGAVSLLNRDGIVVHAVNDSGAGEDVQVLIYKNTGAGASTVADSGHVVVAPTWTWGFAFTVSHSGEYWVRVQTSSESLIPKASFERRRGSLWVPVVTYRPGDFAIFRLKPSRHRVGPALSVCVPSYKKADLPVPGNAGCLARVDDDVRGLWMDNGANWEQVDAHAINVLNYPSLDAATRDIGSETRTLLIPIPVTVASDVTVPRNVTLWFVGSGQLDIVSGKTVIINGPVQAPLKQIFDFDDGYLTNNPGWVPVDFSRMASQIPSFYPQWWGARGDDTGDDSTAFFALIRTYSDEHPPRNNPYSPYNKPKIALRGVYRVERTITIADQDFVSIEGDGRSVIRGVGIAGPVLNFRGSQVQMENVVVRADHSQACMVLYRTAQRGGGNCRFINCTFDGNASQALVYSIASEVSSYINCNFKNWADVPGFVSAGTNVLNMSLPDLNPNCAYGKRGESNSVGLFKFGNFWAHTEVLTPPGAPLILPTDHSTVIRIHNGSDWRFDGLNFYIPGDAEGFRLGSDVGCDDITIANCRAEGKPGYGAGPFVHVVGNVGRLVFTGNDTTDATHVIFVDDDTALGSAYIAGNFDGPRGAPPMYRLGDVQKSTIFAPMANVSFNLTTAHHLISDYSPINSLVHAAGVTYNTPGGQSLESIVYEHNGENLALMRKESDHFKPMSGPLPPAPPQSYGTLVLPDGTNWNPSGLGKKLAFLTDDGGGVPSWFQMPVVGTLANMPAGSVSRGTVGELRFDGNFLYICIEDNEWRRVALSIF